MVQPKTVPPPVRGEWIPMTWEEFLDWPIEGKTEWVAGRGIAYVSNTPRHILMVFLLAKLLDTYLQVLDLGRVFADQLLMRLPQRPSGRMPDVVAVLHAQRERLGERWHEGPAAFVAEFVSEDDPNRDLVEKVAEYEAAGVAEYLAVDARPGRHQLWFRRLGADGRYRLVEPDAEGRYRSEAIPGFWFRAEWFWQDPPPIVEDLLLEIAPEAYEAWITARLRARRERAAGR
jgi:Uma2 family endonuclease